MRGLDPRIHVAGAASIRCEDVDAHGTHPWAEGPRIKSGHDYFELHKDRCAFGSASHGEFPGPPGRGRDGGRSNPFEIGIAFH